jgi:hypothetical protein
MAQGLFNNINPIIEMMKNNIFYFYFPKRNILTTEENRCSFVLGELYEGYTQLESKLALFISFVSSF